MNKIILTSAAITFFILVFSGSSLYAQSPFSYKSSKQIEADFAASQRESKFQMAAWDYSFIGEYLKAKEKIAAESSQNSGVSQLTEQETTYLKSFVPVEAQKFIVEQSRDRQIVIINENHTDPRHRVFTASLLPELYQKGFRYLALEALLESGDKLGERGYPVLDSGFYIKEPQMGNLIREALGLGFKLVSYESEKHKNSEEREINQAKNILKIFETDPPAKVLVHCGHDHIYEGDFPGWGKAMAGRVKEFSAIDPLTVNQIAFTEANTRDSTAPALKITKINKPAVLVDAAGKIFTTLKKTTQWDISVFHPFAEYLNGRPGWLSDNRQKKWYKLPQDKTSVAYPYLALAYREKEPDEATPIDVIEVKDRGTGTLSLFRGNYRIISIDASGKKEIKQVKVK